MPDRKTDTPPEALALDAAQAEHEALAQEIAGHDARYYQDDAPSISDAAYDALRKRLLALEEQFPELASAESPSRKVGAARTYRAPSSSSTPDTSP